MSDGGEDLERQRLVGKSDRIQRWAWGSTGRLFFNCFNKGTGALVSGDAPLPPARTYPSSNGKLTARGSILNVAVREPQKEDRRCRDTNSVLLGSASGSATQAAKSSPRLRRRPRGDRLDVDGQDAPHRSLVGQTRELPDA